MDVQEEGVEVDAEFPVCLTTVEEEVEEKGFPAADGAVEVKAFRRQERRIRGILGAEVGKGSVVAVLLEEEEVEGGGGGGGRVGQNRGQRRKMKNK